MLLVHAHVHAGGLCALAKLGEVVEPLARAPGEWDVRWSGVKQKQLRLSNYRQTERALERRFARFLEIDGAQNAPEALHPVPL